MSIRFKNVVVKGREARLNLQAGSYYKISVSAESDTSESADFCSVFNISIIQGYLICCGKFYIHNIKVTVNIAGSCF